MMTSLRRHLNKLTSPPNVVMNSMRLFVVLLAKDFMQLLFLERNLLDNRFFKVLFDIASLMISLAHKCTNI